MGKIKRNRFFFSNSDFLSCVCCHFFRTTLFWYKLLLHTFQSNYFDTTVTFSEHLFLPQQLLIFLFHFFRTVTFSQELFFQNSFFFGGKILQSSHFLRIGISLWELLFGTAFSEELFRIKISKKELLF